MSEFEWLAAEAEAAIANGARSSFEARIIDAGAEADAGMAIYGSSTYWRREMSAAAHAYAETFGVGDALEAEYRLLVD